ncbi:hypothetical protein QQ045_006853 [Rhodiola kirilowii]
MDKSAGRESCLSTRKLKSVTIGSIDQCVNEALIPGLPDDLALICLAKISHGFLGVLECVCKRWRDVIRSKEYAFYKSRMGRCGDWLFVFMHENDRSRHWKAYDPEADSWHPIPPMPRGNKLTGFSCVSVCNRLLVIGGFCLNYHHNGEISSTNQVLSFDPYRQEWSEVASMSTGRANFACSVICGKVFVGGGYSSAGYYKYNTPSSLRSYNPLSSAEVYDPVKDRWDELPTMPRPWDRCFGVSYNNKFYIMSEVDPNNMDIFSVHDRQWCSRRDVRKSQKQARGRILVINDHLYTIIENSVQTVNIETGDWYHVGSVPAVTLLHPFVCSLRNKLYVIEAIDPHQPDHLVRQRTLRFCDLSTTPLQWKTSMFPSVHSVRTWASLEECLR